MSLLALHAKQLRDKWQARALAASTGKLAAVVLVVLFHNYRDAMPVLLRVVWPDFRDIAKPFLCSGATVQISGRVTCEMIDRDGNKKVVALYRSEDEMIGEFRKLADGLKLDDAERVEMFGAIRNWVVADLRVNHMGVKVAQ